MSGFRGLDGMGVLVTGAGRGIGEATATRLAQEGARVGVLDRDDDMAQAAAASEMSAA